MDRNGRAELSFGPNRRGDRDPGCRPAGLDHQPRLHRPQSPSGPHRRPRPSGRAPDRPGSRPGHLVGANSRGGAGVARGSQGFRAGRLAKNVRLSRHPRLCADRTAMDLSGGSPRGAGGGARGGATRARDRHQPLVEGGTPRRVPRLQPERQGPDDRVGLLGSADARRPGLRAPDLGGAAHGRAGGLHPGDHARPVCADWRSVEGHRRVSRFTRGPARAICPARGGRFRRRALAAAFRQARG